MLLIISLALALLALAGVFWVVVAGSLTTVDGLFMSMILLVMSGIFAANARWEYRHRGRGMWRPARASALAVSTADGHTVLQGIVQDVQFFEAHVGQPTKSVITLSNGSGSSRILVLGGDMRNRLPAGRRVQLVCRDENGLKTLVSAEIS